MAARAAVQFGWILERLQVVGHRDHGKKNHNEHDQRGDLSSQTGAPAEPVAQPEFYEHNGQQCPGEIESRFHSQF